MTVVGVLSANAFNLTFCVVQSFFLPGVFLLIISFFVLDVSLFYLLQCIYLELSLAVWSFLAKRFGRKEDNGCHKATRQLSSKGDQSLRGVQVVSAERLATSGQTLPLPSKRVNQIFSAQKMPAGEMFSECEKLRKSSCLGMPFHFGRSPREEIALGAIEDDAWVHRRQCLREGAEVHRQVRQAVQRKVRPGMELLEIVEMVEKSTSALVGFDPKSPLRRGWAFPTGLSLNEAAAHDTVNPGDARRCLQATDLAKLDFGVHVEGHILDCAFSFTFDPMHDELMEAVREATNVGIRYAGPDAFVSDIGAQIREVMEASEVHRPDGKVLPVRSIKNLTGHLIAPYTIHAGKSLPSTGSGGRARMLAGELWAVETFGSVGGMGYVGGQRNCSHFMRPSGGQPNLVVRRMMSDSAKSLLSIIDRRFSTLAFCPRWLVQEASRCKSPLFDASSQRWWSAPLEELCNLGVVSRYPPLADLPGSYTAQYEHTVLLGARGKEVLTRGSDY